MLSPKCWLVGPTRCLREDNSGTSACLVIIIIIIITTDILPPPTPSCQHLTTTTTTIIQEKWRVQVQIPVVKIWNKNLRPWLSHPASGRIQLVRTDMSPEVGMCPDVKTPLWRIISRGRKEPRHSNLNLRQITDWLVHSVKGLGKPRLYRE